MIFHAPSRFTGAPRRGFALIVVLTAVVLMAILLVAFLNNVSTELQSSKVYSNGAALKLLSQSASNLVMGQIRLATSGSSGAGGLDWASQPGMIRTYDTNGAAAAYYKLYSDDNMQGTGPFDHTLAANGVPSNWSNQRGVYVDLNQPVAVDGTNYFPILDGNAADLSAFTPSTSIGSVKGLAPVANGQPSVAGFWLSGSTPATGTAANQAPMPVKWLYVLQDGQIIAPDSGSTSGTVSFANATTQPSRSNQIIGRIAFWTDDETCKVNINTASEGTFWDTPRSFTWQDYYLAMRQPVQGEFQRYPGHPATVSLSTVLGLGISGTSWTPDQADSYPSLEAFYPVTPATKPGGSKAGTVETDTVGNALTRSVTRLYSTADELLFQPTLASNTRQENAAQIGTPSDLSPDALKKRAFFLTANSQAPDVNVFNLPRVSMWPVTLTAGTPAMTAYDKLAAFCSTINNHIYYFQRQDSTSPTTDLPDNGSATGLPRNRQLLEYLRNLTNKPIPGFGSTTFENKYGDDRQQILTEIFDYIRCTNIQDSSTGATPYTKSLDNGANSPSQLGGKGQVVPIVDNQITVSDSLGGSAHPRGFGRFPTLQQAALVFIGAGNTSASASYVPAVSGAPGFSGSFTTISGSTTQRVQAGFFLQMFDPSQGPAVTYPWYEIQVDGLNSLSWSNDAGTSYSMGFPSTGIISKPYTGVQTLSSSIYGGVNDFRTLAYSRGNTTAANKYPFITPPTGFQNGSFPISPDMNGGQVYFKGGSATVKIYALDATGNRAPATPLQTISLSFPSATLPVPTTIVNSPVVLGTNSGSASCNLRSFYDSGTIKGRLDISPKYLTSWIGSKDVVRAVVATPGDMRLIAPRSVIPNSFFQPISTADYQSTTNGFSHMLRFGYSYPAYGASGGKLVNVNYPGYASKYTSYSPSVPSEYMYGIRAKDVIVPSGTGVVAANNIPADWDNGFGNAQDGAYINKADEGDSGSIVSGTYATNGHPYYELDYNVDQVTGDTFFSPNRMIPSAGMLGSLPTGVWNNKPWQTLLFRPGPAGHPGLVSPPDHLWLDLFNMPVVEPYAISTPLATAGRINMNYLMVPFTYINRDTGLRAAMKSQMITVLSNGSASTYKSTSNPNNSTSFNMPSNVTMRYPVDAEATLSQFRLRFANGDIFRSASEICTIDLVPNGTPGVPATITRSAMDTFWRNNSLTGDNVRERPYANLYPLLTTKSNTYTVHIRVQSLKQISRKDTNSYATWRESTDVVTGQYRGSQTIERYVDPSVVLPDYAASGNPLNETPLSKYYKFRTISNRQFAP